MKGFWSRSDRSLVSAKRRVSIYREISEIDSYQIKDGLLMLRLVRHNTKGPVGLSGPSGCYGGVLTTAGGAIFFVDRAAACPLDTAALIDAEQSEGVACDSRVGFISKRSGDNPVVTALPNLY